ncbi:low molecular weight protein-tyrosine-phosphatase YfkJ [Paenibacillus baekrokdamisoli]|uniref:protein-tyrosine-phosphatase n=1 Tax=Paenibacillus baekrokdamisoli TaxID=1712516 RepID=A0A3G9J563_9BACL|nr:low molecular weight protein-tyrosine-phosphatase [Paenibacillus baekrokdamisoli]MBB3070562.1 protein-tyrosine phosphatase [Paenibacillus baekrokdamisoli]BBH19913.1 low molecular weight protein-tyrosine-phosphatase YfkJ [Paenibacillus baekrokdamisoli]
MISVLFVCLGNICRSPMAEAVFRHQLKEKQLETTIKVDSAGTGDWHLGKVPHEGTRALLDRYGISYEGMRARQVTLEDYTDFDYIVCMDNNNERDVRAIFGSKSDGNTKVFKFMDLLADKKTCDVPDPYYTGNFDEVYELVAAGCVKLLERICEDQLKHSEV